MSEVKNVGQTWMALTTFKHNHLMPLCFEGLKQRNHDSQYFLTLEVIHTLDMNDVVVEFVGQQRLRQLS